MPNTITGRIYKMYPIESREYNGKTYFERTVVINATKFDQNTGEQGYPNFPALVFNGEDKCNELDNFSQNELVTISFELSGVKYNDKQTGEEKFFNKSRGYKMDRVAKYGEQTSQPASHSGIDNFPAQAADNDNLPF